ncbi:MAG: triose-phosphate isomerase [Candidatus Parcubacteria bacterium]|jgi:triosephosphate isomerase
MIKRNPPLVVGNWKATPATKEEAVSFIKKLEKKITASKTKLPKKSYYIAVPDIFIPFLSPLAKHGYIGSENVGIEDIGQHTGLTTPTQLLSSGATFVIIGHSEVRKRGETGEERQLKLKSALNKKLTVVLCLGEQERDKEGKYIEYLEHDTRDLLSLIPRESLASLTIAYEPLWAIGAKHSATANECFEAVIAIRRALAFLVGIEYAKKVHILYGGTVTKDNAVSFLKEGGVNGLLIGRTSQSVDSFFDIIQSVYQ